MHERQPAAGGPRLTGQVGRREPGGAEQVAGEVRLQRAREVAWRRRELDPPRRPVTAEPHPDPAGAAHLHAVVGGEPAGRAEHRRRAERGVAGERDLLGGREDAGGVLAAVVDLRRRERRLREAELAGDGQALLAAEVVCAVDHRQLVAGERPVGEHVDDVVGQPGAASHDASVPAVTLGGREHLPLPCLRRAPRRAFRCSTPRATRWARFATSWRRCVPAACSRGCSGWWSRCSAAADLRADDPGHPRRLRPGDHDRRRQHAPLRAAPDRDPGVRADARPHVTISETGVTGTVFDVAMEPAGPATG